MNAIHPDTSLADDLKLERRAEVMRYIPATPDSIGNTDVISPFDRLIQAATDPNVDVDKMERLLGIAERWKAQEAKAAYARALAVMQPHLPDVRKRGDAAGRYRYALWEDIQDSLRPVLAEHGFSLSFRTAPLGDKAVTVTAVLLHEDGHSESTDLPVAFDTSGNKNPVQAMGSAVSYGKRYTCQALLNLTARGEDDDGFIAGVRNRPDDTGEVISADDARMLRELVAEVNRTEEAFVGYVNTRCKLNITTLDDLPVGALDAARKLLASAKQTLMRKGGANG